VPRVGVGVGVGRLEWHSRQTKRTCARVNMRGLAEPCGMWQAVQPPDAWARVRSERPDLVAVALKQPGSLALTVCMERGRKLPCGLWQSTQDMALPGAVFVRPLETGPHVRMAAGAQLVDVGLLTRHQPVGPIGVDGVTACNSPGSWHGCY